MGFHLQKRLADKYLAVGSMFYDGSFRTYSLAKGGLVEHVVRDGRHRPPVTLHGIRHNAARVSVAVGEGLPVATDQLHADALFGRADLEVEGV